MDLWEISGRDNRPAEPGSKSQTQNGGILVWVALDWFCGDVGIRGEVVFSLPFGCLSGERLQLRSV